MQQSYGEGRVEIENQTCGAVRVRAIYSEPALYPRLGFRLGWHLRDFPSHGNGQSQGLTSYRLTDLRAELRVGYGGGGPFVGHLWSTEGGVEVRSSQYHSENQVTLACDLDLARLEQIEERRNGQRPQFSINLWPTFDRDGQRLQAQWIRLDFQIPRDDWLEFLGAVGFGDYDVLEFKRLTASVEAFQDVRDQLAVARTRIDLGEYNAAMGAVRTALERAIQQSRDSELPLKDLLSARTDDVRGTAYAAIIKQIKDICSRAVHKPDASVSFARAEALYVARAAEASIALLGALIAPPS